MFKRVMKKILNGTDEENRKKEFSYPSDYSDFEKSVVETVKPITMTGHERIISLMRAVEYVLDSNLDGDFLECGVWKGGSVMTMLEVLNERGVSRDLYLYDTFEGMSEPTDDDFSYDGTPAKNIFDEKKGGWCLSRLDEVKDNLSSFVQENRIHYIEGKVEDTIPKGNTPEKIALLRLDTDWYESTKHELTHLFPRLVDGGVLIIDDYGHWEGCKKAVDEYFEENNIHIFLNRVDYTCRLGVKHG